MGIIMTPQEYLGLVIIAIGFIMVITAKTVVNKFNLGQKQKCEHSEEMTEVEVQDYKESKAIFKFKIIGLVVTVPGLILYLIVSLN